MLRNIPAACDFNFTATWLAGRLFAFKSTVPEIFPSICSELRTCAFAIGAQRVAVMLRKRIARNPAFSEHFLRFCNLHSISTCCALLRYSSGDLAVGRVNPHGRELPLPTVTFRLRLWSRLRR